MSRLVDEGKIDLIEALDMCRCLLIVFMLMTLWYTTKVSYLAWRLIKLFFLDHDVCSSQIINAMKSSIHFGGINQNRMAHIVNVLGFTIGSLPLRLYLP